MFKILIVFGTRPEAIKMAPIVLTLQKHPNLFEVKVCVTAQHREMLDQVNEIFGIFPDIDLNIMKPGQGLSDLTSTILTDVSAVLKEIEPNLVLVHGDTTTTLATSLASFYAGIPIGHVEAGLRTHNLKSPFPEELNRQIVSKIANIHFAPTTHCKNNLLSEGIPDQNIYVTGNSVIDALEYILKLIEDHKEIRNPVLENLDAKLKFKWQNSKYVLVTGHRRENFGEGFIQICQALEELSQKYPEFHFVYPVHLNPNVQEPVHKILGKLGNVHLIEPLDYLSFSMLLSECYFVLTDSGGLQEEAPSLGKPLLLMRDTTERPEALEAGTIALVGPNKTKIVVGVDKLIKDDSYYNKMSNANNPYGDGDTSELIMKSIVKHFNLSSD
jgi:UDP-N-acetylglucosamine 2-epimerase (non-hydrolysing)